jgi:hypothetical protein
MIALLAALMVFLPFAGAATNLERGERERGAQTWTLNS